MAIWHLTKRKMVTSVLLWEFTSHLFSGVLSVHTSALWPWTQGCLLSRPFTHTPICFKNVKFGKICHQIHQLQATTYVATPSKPPITKCLIVCYSSSSILSNSIQHKPQLILKTLKYFSACFINWPQFPGIMKHSCLLIDFLQDPTQLVEPCKCLRFRQKVIHHR